MLKKSEFDYEKKEVEYIEFEIDDNGDREKLAEYLKRGFKQVTQKRI